LIAVFQSGTALQKKAAFILTEISLSVGKYFPVLKQPKLVNLNYLVLNILRSSAIYCAYIGYKFRLEFSELESEQQKQLQRWVENFFERLMVTEADLFKANYTENQAALNVCYWGANYSLRLLGMRATYNVKQTPLIKRLEQTFVEQDKFLRQSGTASVETDTEEMSDDDYDF
jgi:ribonucleoside-diphosphate reductase beta chain